MKGSFADCERPKREEDRGEWVNSTLQLSPKIKGWFQPKATAHSWLLATSQGKREPRFQRRSAVRRRTKLSRTAKIAKTSETAKASKGENKVSHPWSWGVNIVSPGSGVGSVTFQVTGKTLRVVLRDCNNMFRKQKGTAVDSGVPQSWAMASTMGSRLDEH